MSVNKKKIGEGRNAFFVSQSDYDNGFKGNQIEVWHGKVSTMQDAHNIRKEVARIEAIKPVSKPLKSIKKGRKKS
jgi:hypothetical protein